MSTNREENTCEMPMILEEKLIKTSKKNQYIGGFTVSLSGFCAGTVIAWTSPALEYLLEDKSNTNQTAPSLPGFTISTSEESIIGAILMFGGFLFAIPSGKCASLFGRKFTLILIAFLYLVSYVLIACANNVLTLVIARFLGGLALGGCCVVSPLYIGEIAEESLRGILGSVFSVLLGLGILYTNIIGCIVSNWVGLSVGLGLSAVVAGIPIFFLPETPIYLVSKEQTGKAKRSLIFFRGSEKVAAQELTELQKNNDSHETEGTITELFSKTCYRIPLIAGLGVFIYQQLCGINIVVFYIVPIFKAAGSNLNPSFQAIITNFITLLVGILAVFVIEKRSRKYFLLLSAVCMFVGAFGLGMFFQLKQYGVHFPGLQLLPISCVVLFMAGFSIGLGPVPWILLIELYTPEIRGIASGVMVVSSWLAAFLVTFSFPYLMHFIGNAWTFYLYGFLNVLGILFIWFVVPETKSKERSKTGSY